MKKKISAILTLCLVSSPAALACETSPVRLTLNDSYPIAGFHLGIVHNRILLQSGKESIRLWHEGNKGWCYRNVTYLNGGLMTQEGCTTGKKMPDLAGIKFELENKKGKFKRLKMQEAKGNSTRSLAFELDLGTANDNNHMQGMSVTAYEGKKALGKFRAEADVKPGFFPAAAGSVEMPPATTLPIPDQGEAGVDFPQIHPIKPGMPPATTLPIPGEDKPMIHPIKPSAPWSGAVVDLSDAKTNKYRTGYCNDTIRDVEDALAFGESNGSGASSSKVRNAE